MKITLEKKAPAYRLPTATASGPFPPGSIPPNRWETGFWLQTFDPILKSALDETGYTCNVEFSGALKLTFEGNTYTNEELPPFCITGVTKFVDKFSDLAKLDEALITKVWDNLIAFIGTLPQPSDRGFSAYKTLLTDYEKLESAEQKDEMDAFKAEMRISALERENHELKKRLAEFESIKAKLAECCHAEPLCSH